MARLARRALEKGKVITIESFLSKEKTKNKKLVPPKSVKKEKRSLVIDKQSEDEWIMLQCSRCITPYRVLNPNKAPYNPRNHLCHICQALAVCDNPRYNCGMAEFVKKGGLVGLNNTEGVNAATCVLFMAFNYDKCFNFLSRKEQVKMNLLEDKMMQRNEQFIKMLKQAVNQEKKDEMIQPDASPLGSTSTTTPIYRYQELPLCDLLSESQLEKCIQIQTGQDNIIFRKDQWRQTSNKILCDSFGVSEPTDINRSPRKSYSQQEITDIIENGIFATKSETIEYLNEILPHNLIQEPKSVLDVDACLVCMTTTDNMMTPIKVCRSCIINLRVSPLTRQPINPRELLKLKEGENITIEANVLNPSLSETFKTENREYEDSDMDMDVDVDLDSDEAYMSDDDYY